MEVIFVNIDVCILVCHYNPRQTVQQNLLIAISVAIQFVGKELNVTRMTC